jgi:hypothetical protein
MIFVFVVDTSPSMGQPALSNSSLSRLDVAKMAVEDFHRQWRKLRNAPIRTTVQNASENAAASLLGPLGQLPTQEDQFLLLSTSRQHSDTALCAAGGRLLVGFPPPAHPQWLTHSNDGPAEAFQRELKQLKVATIDPSSNVWLDEWGGASGLNIALSAGLELLSRYRLMNKHTEHFGMGRLPNNSVMINTTGSSTHVVQVAPAVNALQPACLVLLTDGACLRLSERQGGGSLQLHYGSQPLRELYQEPFRWDQRIFIQAVGVTSSMTSTQYLHPQLRALSEVTGGAHFIVKWNGNVQGSTDILLKHICPPMPLSLPLPDPLYKRLGIPAGMVSYSPIVVSGNAFFVNGGPIASFHCLEDSAAEKKSTGQRAMLLYVGSPATQNPQSESSTASLSPPLFCIAESYFPSKMLDTLPPRSAQPKLYYSRYPAVLGSKSFVPTQVIQQLHRLDQLLTSNHKRKAATTPARLLHRDVYICEWRDAEGGTVKSDSPLSSNVPEYVPVFVPGAGRPSLSEDGENYLNIGIMHIASVTPASKGPGPSRSSAGNLTTLTLLPPEPQILLPLLLRVAEQEHRAWKKSVEGNQIKSATATSADAQPTKVHVSIDEAWKSEFRAYLFRIPPYYHNAVKRCLRSILPSSVHNLLHLESTEVIVSQCFSKVCHQKIRNGELIAKEYTERMERQETMIRFSKTGAVSSVDAVGPLNDADLHPKQQKVGHYDPRCSTDSYLASLRSIPAPWRLFGPNHESRKGSKNEKESSPTLGSQLNPFASPTSALDDLGDLPADCLLAFHESRRRWIFGGPGLTIRGLHVEGAPNDGSNSQRRGNVASSETNDQYDCLLSIGGVGASTLNETTTTKMGEYRERLLFSRSPIVGYGSNDAAGVSATTAIGMCYVKRSLLDLHCTKSAHSIFSVFYPRWLSNVVSRR